MVKIFDLDIKENTLQVKGITINNFPFIYESIINSLKSISLAKIGLFFNIVIRPSQVPKFFRVLKAFSSMYKLFILSKACIYLIVYFKIYLYKDELFTLLNNSLK